jgi:hypothetical protein
LFHGIIGLIVGRGEGGNAVIRTGNWRYGCCVTGVRQWRLFVSRVSDARLVRFIGTVNIAQTVRRNRWHHAMVAGLDGSKFLFNRRIFRHVSLSQGCGHGITWAS